MSKHGQVIDLYMPIERDREQATRAVESLGRSVDEVSGVAFEQAQQAIILAASLYSDLVSC